MSGVKLAGVSDDLKGLVYEEIIRNTFDKGDNQQFFTPRPIVEFMVRMLSPFMAGKICDPACGTGGFLLYVQKFLRQQGLHDHATLTGFEIDERLAWAAGVNLDMYDSACRFRVSHLNSAGSLGHCLNSETGTMDTIVTNPPFGSDLSGREALNEFALGQGKTSRRRGVLFIERCLDLLKPGGVVGIIIDDSVLNGPSNVDTRNLILERSYPMAIVSLPETAFMPYASVKASILFLQKRRPDQLNQGDDPPTFFAHAATIGRKPNGEPLMRTEPLTGKMVLDSSLPELLTIWENLQADYPEHVEGTHQQFFRAKVPHITEETFERDGFRLDPAYHQPARRQSGQALRSSQHPRQNDRGNMRVAKRGGNSVR